MSSKKAASGVLLTLLALQLLPYPVMPQPTNYFSTLMMYWGTDKTVEVSPGDVATLNIILRYEFQYSTKGVAAELLLPDVFMAVGGCEAITYFSGTVSMGSIIQLEFSLFIAKDAAIGSHMAFLELEYYVGDLARWRRELLEVWLEVTGKPSIEVAGVNDTVSEGKQNVLVILRNKGDAAANNIRIVSIHATSASVEMPENTFLGQLRPRENAAIPLSIYVPVELKTSILALTVEVSCVGPTSILYSFSKTIELTLKTSTPASPLIFSLDPEELPVGKTSKLYLGVKNTANHNLTAMKVSLTPDATLKVFGKTSFYVERLEPGKTERLYTEIYVPPTTTTTTATLSIASTHFDENLRITRSSEERLSLRLRGLIDISPLSWNLESKELAIAKSSRTCLEVKNDGNYNLLDMKVSLTPDATLKVFGKTSFYVERLEPGKTERLYTEIYVPPTTTTTTATLSIAVTYVDEKLGAVKSDEQRLSLLLRGSVELSVADVMIIPSTPISGRSFTTTATIINTGTSGAYATYATAVIEGLPVTYLAARSTFVGDVTPNIPTSFSINLQLLNTTLKSIVLPVLLTYADNLRSTHNMTFEIPLTITMESLPPSPQAPTALELPSLLTFLLIGLLIVATVVTIVYILRRTRKKG